MGYISSLFLVTEVQHGTYILIVCPLALFHSRARSLQTPVQTSKMPVCRYCFVCPLAAESGFPVRTCQGRSLARVRLPWSGGQSPVLCLYTGGLSPWYTGTASGHAAWMYPNGGGLCRGHPDE